jgi:hypothetical protein
MGTFEQQGDPVSEITVVAPAPSAAVPFVEFPSIARLSRDVIVTEKIDGTNAQVFIRQLPDDEVMPTDTPIVAVHGNLLLYAGSRSRWITPEDDNFGFARWVREHADELAALGPGSHFGEWWGSGIQRKYGLAEKRFSLFNVGRWSSNYNQVKVENDTVCREVPCCHVVPVLLRWTLDTAKIDEQLDLLAKHGSRAAPGFDKPEGIVVFHTKSGTLFKKTLDKNDGHKSV